MRPKKEKTLPVVLSRDEVRQLLGTVRLPRYRVCLTTIDTCGLLLREALHLQIKSLAAFFSVAPHESLNSLDAIKTTHNFVVLVNSVIHDFYHLTEQKFSIIIRSNHKDAAKFQISFYPREGLVWCKK